MIAKGSCIIYWKNGKRTSFIAVLPDERDELIEVIGSHLKKFKQSTGIILKPMYLEYNIIFTIIVKQIQLLKDIYRCKVTKFNPDFPEHAALLKRLWTVLYLSILKYE
jgi:hypothetical protein